MADKRRTKPPHEPTKASREVVQLHTTIRTTQPQIAQIIGIDPKYCDVIIKRWQDFTGQQAVHENTGKNFSDMEAERAS